MNITIDAGLKKKCPRTALGCVTARVEPGPSPVALLGEMNQRELEIQELPFPRGVLESPEIESVRKAYKALGKAPARYRGSGEALFRRIVAGKGFPQITAVWTVSISFRLKVACRLAFMILLTSPVTSCFAPGARAKPTRELANTI